MPEATVKKANFTAGELAPTLYERSDIDQYGAGAAKLRNVTVMPHGGVKRRPGTEFVDHCFQTQYIPILPASNLITIGSSTTTDFSVGTTLTDSLGAFTSTISVGDIVNNATEGTTTYVSAVVSDTELTLEDGIMENSGESYSTFKVGPVSISTLTGITDIASADISVLYCRCNLRDNQVGYFIADPSDYTLDMTGGLETITLNFDTVNFFTPRTGDRCFILMNPEAYNDPTIGASHTTVWGHMTDMTDTADLVAIREFEFSNTQTYLLVFSTFTLAIYKKDSTTGVTELQAILATPYGSASIPELKFAHELDTLFVFHKQHRIQKIQRQGEHWDWERTDHNLVYVPQHEYNDTYSPSNAENHKVEHVMFTFITGNFFTITVDGEETDGIEFSVPSGGAGSPAEIAASQPIANALAALSTTPSDGAVLNVDYSFTWAYVLNNSYSCRVEYIGDNGGRAYDITSKAGSGKWADNNEVDYSVLTKGHGDEEDIMSDQRGWPRCGVFHGGRLWVGGLYSLPQTILGSRVNAIEIFSDEETLADYGINYTMKTSTVSSIFNITASRQLTMLTSNGEYYVPISATDPITPENFSVRLSSKKGSKDGIRSQEIDGAVYFVQRFGKALNELMYREDTQSLEPTSISNLSQHLIVDPVDLAYRPATDTEDANYLYAPNSDGTMAVFNSLREQGISAWSLWETTGTITSVAVVDVDVYQSVWRTIKSVSKLHIERYREDMYVDCGVIGTESSGGVTSVALDHLQNEAIDVLRNGTVQKDILVTNLGSNDTFPLVLVDDDTYQAGLPFPIVDGDAAQVWVQTLAFDAGGNGQSTLSDESSLKKVTLSLIDTSSVRVGINDSPSYPIPLRTLGTGLLDQPVPVFSGYADMPGLKGWNRTSKINITQREPLPFTLRGIIFKVKF